MARKRRKQSENIVSLFPFLSILACVIGTLTLMITGLTLSQVGKEQPAEERIRFEQFESVQSEIQQTEESLADVKLKVQQAEALQRQLAAANQELQELASTKKDVTSSNSEQAGLLAESGRLRSRVNELKQEAAEQQKQIADLTRQLAKLKRRHEAEVMIRPGGTGIDIDPTFVEVNATGVVIYEGSKLTRVRRAEIDKPGGVFHKLVDNVSKRPKGSVIFLLRSDPAAIATYNTARYVARTRYCPNGKLPVPGDGIIDISIFDRKG